MGPTDATPAATVATGAAAPDGSGWWASLRDPATGRRLFVAGLLGLLFSIGGLVTAGLRRRRW